MRAHSTDLRERVVAACGEGDATRERVAARFAVSVSGIRKRLRQRRETGSITPRPRGGGRAPAFDAAAAGRLRAAIRAAAAATREAPAHAAGVSCCPSAG